MLCFRSLSHVDFDRPETQQQYYDYEHQSSVEPGSRPQSGSASELQQIVVTESSPATVPRVVKTRRSKKSSKSAVYAFADPLSKCLNLSKLARSEFDWRTLTAIRPSTELEQRFITRLVELERLQVLDDVNMLVESLYPITKKRTI